MSFRKEEEITLYGSTYKVKQLAGTTGARILLQLTRLIMKGAGSISDLLQNENVKKIIKSFFTDELKLSPDVLAILPPEIEKKLMPLLDKVYPSSQELKTALSQYLSAQELDKYYLKIVPKAALSSTPEFSTILSASGHLLILIRDIIITIDLDEFDDLFSGLINRSVIRYQPAGQEKFIKWQTTEGYAFDDCFAGNYNQMLELFVYLALFNYAESIIMLKKNQILSYLQPYLKKLKPEEETKS